VRVKWALSEKPHFERHLHDREVGRFQQFARLRIRNGAGRSWGNAQLLPETIGQIILRLDAKYH